MNRFVSVLFTLLFSATSIYAQSKQLSLKEAVSYALANNPTFRNAELEERMSEEKVKEAGNALLPKLTGGIDTRYNTQLATQVLPARTFNPNASEGELTKTVFGTNWNASASLDLTAPILDFGASANVDYAKAAQNLASATKLQTKQSLTETVTRAYYAVLLNQEKLRQAETTLARNENLYKDVQTKFQNANALKTDLNTAYLNASNAQLQRRKATDALTISRMNLALQLGYDGNSAELQLTDNLATLISTDSTFANASNDEAFEARTDTRSERAQREMNIQALQRIGKQQYPSLTGYGFLGTQGFSNDISKLEFFPLSYIGLRINVPLSDWLTRTPLVQQQLLALDKNENTLRNLRRTIQYDRLNAQTMLQNSFRAATLQRENIGIAEEIVATTTVRFKQGQVTQQDVFNAEQTLRDTEAAYLQAVYDFLVAKLEWEKANGRL